MTHDDFRIQLARPDQLDEYLNFLEAVALWLDQRGVKQWMPGNFHKSRTYYAQSIANGETWLAYAGTDLIGTIRVLDTEPAVWPEITPEDGVYIYNLAVSRVCAGQGVGAKLLAWADNLAKRKARRYVRLDCMADNDFLQAYYLRAGFVSRGVVTVTYPAPIGELHLHRFERSVEAAVGESPNAKNMV